METLGKFTVIVLVIVSAFLLSLFLSYVILSIANLYQLSFITQFSFVQVFGTTLIIGLLKYTYKKPEENKKEKSFGDIMIESGSALLTTGFTTLWVWGIAFLAYYILT